MLLDTAHSARTGWWRDAVIYQVYLRSFADGNGDGVGDLAGLRSRLPYLAALGIDAIWITPWYPSPMADAGYDVADYRDIDPAYGTLAEAETLIAQAHAVGIRVVIDIVPNHCSSEHPWFRAALTPGAPERALFHFRPGRGVAGELPPNDWPSYFGGPAWTRTAEGDWYLHLFAPEQPDLNWDQPAVREEFLGILAFWLDRGVDGFRIDVAHALVKDPALPDVGDHPDPRGLPYQNQPGVHQVFRDWRALLEARPGDTVLVGEIWLPDPSSVPLYVRPDELHSAFNFDYLCCAWDADALRAVIDGTLASYTPVGAPSTWVLSNHDVTRQVTRFGRTETSYDPEDRRHLWPVDLELGLRRARAAALLTMALPGGVYLYQGEELGLADVEDLPMAARQDPVVLRSGGASIGRDGCRVPLPWSGEVPPYGFGGTADTWLPQPLGWGAQSVAVQEGDQGSMLTLYRDALHLRRRLTGPMQWLEAPDGVLALRRGDIACWVNISDRPVRPPGGERLIASTPLVDGWLQPDAAVWIRG